MRQRFLFAINNFCQVDGCPKLPTQIHHIKPQTKVNKKKFPLFINSPFNWYGICDTHHITNEKKIPKQPNDQLCQLYEEYLTSLRLQKD